MEVAAVANAVDSSEQILYEFAVCVLWMTSRIIAWLKWLKYKSRGKIASIKSVQSIMLARLQLPGMSTQECLKRNAVATYRRRVFVHACSGGGERAMNVVPATWRMSSSFKSQPLSRVVNQQNYDGSCAECWPQLFKTSARSRKNIKPLHSNMTWPLSKCARVSYSLANVNVASSSSPPVKATGLLVQLVSTHVAVVVATWPGWNAYRGELFVAASPMGSPSKEVRWHHLQKKSSVTGPLETFFTRLSSTSFA